ncbi:ABC transporter permease [Sinorhizobium psoraleae]|uniref:ABC transporter permease subunit n=1 Tax=Sinorhizobium psoraleae TaxID=520838 RepID=A0ABT4KPI5_9HYPH|nr:ABC transporter permease subunit [Sinorhizobium psoraleae]MCZ4093690.1 ABC transporter permease subunit [Sinorhizobium psoraleae]
MVQVVPRRSVLDRRALDERRNRRCCSSRIDSSRNACSVRAKPYAPTAKTILDHVYTRTEYTSGHCRCCSNLLRTPKLGAYWVGPGIVLAHSVVAIGIVVVIVSGTLANFDQRLEQAANSMRAGPIQTFIRITLPLILPGIIGGSVFAFLSSFDDIVITSLISGFSLRTLPLKMWENIRNQIDPTMAAVSSLLMLVPILWLVALYAMWWRAKAKGRSSMPELVA